MSDLVQSKANTLKKLLDASKSEIEAALPRHLTPDRMLRIALTEARKNPALLECTQASFLGAIVRAAQLGLEPASETGHVWLIPFNNRKNNTREVQFVVGYKGMIELAGRSAKVSHFIARSVHEGDEFKYEFGLHEDIKHIPCSDPGKLTHVYAIVFLKDGGKIFDVMTSDEIQKIKKKSKAADSGPWVTHFDEMAKKTVVRRLFKYSPMSIEIQTAVGLDELNETEKSQMNADVIETTGTVVESEPEQVIAKIKAKPQESSPFNDFKETKIVEQTERASVEQMGRLLSASRALNITPPQINKMCEEKFKVKRAVDLTSEQADALISELENGGQK